MDLSFSPDESQKIQDITELYSYYKTLATIAEELKDQSFMPPINEIKDSLDHMMRVFSVKCEFQSKNGDYIDNNLNAVFRHIYRAIYDLLDYIRIYQKEKIYQKMKVFSRETIVTIFPEYYHEIVSDVDRCVQTIPILKADKDIGDPNIEKVKTFVVLSKKLQNYCLQIDKIYPALIEYEEKKKLEDRINWIKVGLGAATIASIIGAIIGVILAKIFY